MNKFRAIVVEQGRNPSYDFFVIPQLQRLGYCVQRCSLADRVDNEALIDALVIFVRYVSPAWRQRVNRIRFQLSGIVYFFDDDLFSWSAFSSMPLRYQFKLLRYAYSQQWWLKKIGAQFWVSTPFLQQRYSLLKPTLVLPKPVLILEDSPSPKTSDTITLFYHGSASHYQEVKWLLPIIQQVLAQRSHVKFEIIGNPEVNALLQGMPRTRVLEPMGWPAYLKLLGNSNRHIGLAPMLGLPFNHARSYTKFYDITAAGSIGIYSDASEFGQIVKDSVNGYLLPMQPQLWLDAMLRLIDDTGLRTAMYKQARACYLLQQSAALVDSIDG